MPATRAVQYQVVVGNIGEVYRGDSQDTAWEIYREYRQKSQLGYGRAAGEFVLILKNDKPYREFTPTEQPQPAAKR
jgi:hypothetical protein